MIRGPCDTCGSTLYRCRQFINETKSWICDLCGASATTVYDVYWDGKPEENLADGPDDKPIVFASKGQKARYMRERGIEEAGDRVRGAPFSPVMSEKSKSSREEVRAALAKVRSMGADVRRQEYLRICKEAERRQNARQ